MERPVPRQDNGKQAHQIFPEWRLWPIWRPTKHSQIGDATIKANSSSEQTDPWGDLSKFGEIGIGFESRVCYRGAYQSPEFHWWTIVNRWPQKPWLQTEFWTKSDWPGNLSPVWPYWCQNAPQIRRQVPRSDHQQLSIEKPWEDPQSREETKPDFRHLAIDQHCHWTSAKATCSKKEESHTKSATATVSKNKPFKTHIEQTSKISARNCEITYRKVASTTKRWQEWKQ